MVRQRPEGSAPDLQSVLEALTDPDCRAIVSVLSEPMTAEEISSAADIPLSTTYRKLDILTEAGLLEEGIKIRPNGQHATQYSVGFDEVRIGLSEDREFELDVSRLHQPAEERLATLWSEVQKET